MPLLARLLGRREPASPSPPPLPPPPPHPPQPPPPPLVAPDQRHGLFEFSKEQVRVLLFKECDKSGRKLLFDSSAVQRVSVNDIKKTSDFTFGLFQNKDDKKSAKNPAKANIVEISQGFGYQCTSPTSDVNLLGEMIFGAVAMNFKGMSLKVHVLNAPDRLMCTKVFCPSPNIRRRSRIVSTNLESVESTSYNSCRSNLDCVTNIESNPSLSRRSSLNYSSNNQFVNNHRNLSTSLDMQPLSEWSTLMDDSGINRDFSSLSSVSSYSNNDYYEKDDCEVTDDVQYFKCFSNVTSPQIGSNLQWRLNRHLYTSLAHTPYSSSNTSTHHSSCDSQFLSSNSEASTSDSISSNSNSSKSGNLAKRKLGLAIIISLSNNSEMEMFKFLMEHGLLVEAALDRLCLAVKNLCYERHSFITKMSQATEETAQWLVDLMSGPKLKWPLWLCLAGTPKTSSPDRLANDFLRDLCFLLKTMDTKDTYFFMSTLITNVLIYHLGWVNSVSPYNAPIATQQKELDYLNIAHPYNPLWAQIGELYGAIGTPPRLSKTFICSKKSSNTVNRILCVLSYFIRCGEVKRFEVDSKNLSWETLDCLIDNHKSEKSFHTAESEISNDFNASNDCIEMSTFSSNGTLIGLSDKNTKLPVSSNNLTGSETKQASKSNLSKPLKRTKSCNVKSIDSAISNHSSDNLNLSESSLCSVTTLVPSVDKCVVNDCETLNSGLPTNIVECENHLKGGDSSESFEKISLKDDLVDLDSESLNMNKKDSKMNNTSNKSKSKDVLFVLGDNEPLIGIKNKSEEKLAEPSIADSQGSSSSSNGLKKYSKIDNIEPSAGKSLKTDVCCEQKSLCKHSKSKKHSGVKFEFDKYPQIVTNYMKSKNLELLDRHMIGKPGNLKIDGYEFEGSSGPLSVPNESDSCVNCSLNSQALQTPSNASELEFTSDIPPNDCEIQYPEKFILPVIVEPSDDRSQRVPKIFIRTKLENTLIVNWNGGEETMSHNANVKADENVQLTANVIYSEIVQEEKIELPIPLCTVKETLVNVNSAYCHPLMSDVSDHYISDMVLQGVVSEDQNWENQIRRDLHLQSRSASGGAICLYADVDDWAVKIMGFNGGTAGMSTLVATMLDTLFHMYKSKVPAKQCLKFIESKLKEFCIRSKTLAEMLLDTDFCDINYLTKALSLDPNDVPLLMAIASTHSPQVALKYGVSYR